MRQAAFHSFRLRNSILWLGMLAAGFSVAVIPVTGEEAGATTRTKETPMKILLITGGGWHDFHAQKTILTEGLGQRLRVEFTVDDEAGTDPTAVPSRFPNPDWAAGYDLVLYNISLSRDQTAETAQAIIDSHVKHRVPAALLHGSVHSYRFAENPNWFRFLGGRSMRHERQHPFANEVLDPDHPVMAGFPDPWRQPQGELYVIEEIFPTATPLAHAYGVETETRHPTIWVNEFENVRVFVTTIGHHNETMAADTYLDLLARGILWAVGADAAKIP